MIYFLVNNDYHLNLDLKLTKQLSGFEIGLIQVPYSLKIINSSDVFSRIYHFPDRITSSLVEMTLRPKSILEIKKKVDNVLIPECADILLVHTEMDLLNQYIIQKFFDAKAKIYIIEDGVATMCYFNMKPQKAPLKDRIKTFVLQKLYKLKYTVIKVYGIEILPTMKDFIFSGVIVNFGNSISRNLPLYKLTSFEEPLNISHETGAIFFNQNPYLWICTEDQYINYISDMLKEISSHFNPFYFKFHPSDTKYVIESITKLISTDHSNIIIIDDTDIAEHIIIKYPVKYAITINSTAAFNLINRGVCPIFLNYIFNQTFPDTSFVAFNELLTSINCSIPTELSDVKPGFSAFSAESNNLNSRLLIDILR